MTVYCHEDNTTHHDVRHRKAFNKEYNDMLKEYRLGPERCMNCDFYIQDGCNHSRCKLTPTNNRCGSGEKTCNRIAAHCYDNAGNKYLVRVCKSCNSDAPRAKDRCFPLKRGKQTNGTIKILVYSI